MRLLSGIGAMLRRAFPGRSVVSSQNEEQTVREQVTDAGYFETVSVRYASAQLIAIMLLAVFLGVSLLTDSDLLSADNLIYFAKDMTSSVSMRENAARDTLVYTASEDADRVLYIGVTLRLKDEATRSRLSEYLPEVRSRLLLLFSRQDAAVLATEEGKKNLIAEIKTTLSTPLVAGQPKQDVTDVLYTAFILR